MSQKSVSFGKNMWIDFDHPNEHDITYLQERFDIHPLAVEEFTTPTFRPKATRYENCLFLTVHIPLFDPERKTTYAGEVDILLTDTHLITGHNEPIPQLNTLFAQLEKSEGKRRLHLAKTPAHLLYALIETLVESCFPRLDNIVRKINEVEDEVFNGNEKEMVREISFVKRDILNFRRTLMPQRSILESLAQKDTPYISQDLTPFFQDLVGTNIRIWNTLQNAKETIESLEETNASLLSHKLNEKMRVLTIFSVVLLPSTIYANILGMNPTTPLDPEEGPAFWVHIGIIAIIALAMLGVFRWRKWI